MEVHLVSKMTPETIFKAVNILDRFLSKVSIKKECLQLAGVTALFIAAKYQEIYYPELKDFAFYTDSACTEQEILQMEGQMLSVLDFDLGSVSALVFLDRLCQLHGFNKGTPFKRRLRRLLHLLVRLGIVSIRVRNEHAQTRRIGAVRPLFSQ